MAEKWRRGRAPWETEGQTRERDIETYLRDEVRKIGGKAYKFLSPGNDGVPDRLICLPGGRVVFVELKAPGKTSTVLQRKKQLELTDFGLIVFVDIDSVEKVNDIIKVMRDYR